MENDLFTVKATITAGLTTLGAFLGWKGVLLCCWVAVMALDYISGTAAACKEGKWSSAVARQGLWHKAGMILAVLVAGIADVALHMAADFLPIGIEWPGLIMPMVLAWYIVTELGSILENAVRLGAAVPKWLVKMLEATAHVIDKTAEENSPEDPAAPDNINTSEE